MTSREAILQAVAAAQPEARPLPQVAIQPEPRDPVQQFIEVLQGIGGKVYQVQSRSEALRILEEQFAGAGRIIVAKESEATLRVEGFDAHTLENVDLAIIDARLGVAENGVVWVTDEELPQRVLPFIAQHLAVVVRSETLVPTMHKAYEVIGASNYGFGVFIAGPSKTADIEQSLVLGAHGARTMQVFLV